MDSQKTLKSRLSTWKVQPPSNSAFRANVWAQIDTAQNAPTFAAFVSKHATACIVLLVLTASISAGAGYFQAVRNLERQRLAMLDQYIISIEPRFVVASEDHHLP